MVNSTRMNKFIMVPITSLKNNMRIISYSTCMQGPQNNQLNQTNENPNQIIFEKKI